MATVQSILDRQNHDRVDLGGTDPGALQHLVRGAVATDRTGGERGRQLRVDVVLAQTRAADQLADALVQSIRLEELQAEHDTRPAVVRVQTHGVRQRVRRPIVVAGERVRDPELVRDLRVVGISKAMEWVATWRVFGPDQALAAGLVSEVHPPDALLGRAMILGEEIASSTSAVSVALSRQMLWTMLGASPPMEAHILD